MNARVRFEDEADAEYRLAGRRYEDRREHLGLEFREAPVLHRLPDLGDEASRSPLADMTISERLIADYSGTGLTVGAHPLMQRPGTAAA